MWKIWLFLEGRFRDVEIRDFLLISLFKFEFRVNKFYLYD